MGLLDPPEEAKDAEAPPEAAEDAEVPPEAAERCCSSPRGCYAAAPLSSEEQEAFLHPTRPGGHPGARYRPGGHPRAVQASCPAGASQAP